MFTGAVMLGLYIGSTHPKAGKTLCATALGVLLQKKGVKVGYIKPVGDDPKSVETGNGDAGALVVQELLGQDVLPEDLTPVMCALNWTALGMARCDDYAARNLTAVKKAYASIAKGHDLTLVSGVGVFPVAGQFAGVDGLTLVNELNLQVLLVETIENGINFDAVLFAKRLLGKRFLGVILNKLPKEDVHLCRKWVLPYLKSYDVDVLGIIPNDQELNVIRCMDLAYELKGRIVAGNNRAAGMGITNFTIGSMQIDAFMAHIRDKSSCAIILGGDRTDLQLAALCSNLNCLVLTGNIGPSELIRVKAEAQDVPIIVVKENTFAVARRINQILKSHKFNDLEQINRGISLFDQSVDIELFWSAALASKAINKHS
jgi:BioD-like phosphotransacetylase family protein